MKELGSVYCNRPEVMQRVRRALRQPVAFICANCGNPLSHRVMPRKQLVKVLPCVVCVVCAPGIPAP